MLTDKKRIKTKLVCLILVIMMIYIAFGRRIEAYAEFSKETNVPVTYTKGESISYIVTLEVKGDGYVFDGENKIEDSSKKYLLKLDESMKFKLKPKKNSKISNVILNGENIKENILNNEIIIEGQEREQKLVVEFTSSISGNPQTGDSNEIYIYILLLLISTGGFILLNNKSKYKK